MNQLKTIAIAACAALGILATGLRAAEPTAEETQAMQGTWTIESFTLNGNKIDPEQLRNWRRIVAGSHVTWTNNGQTLVETDIQFDPCHKPPTLDSTIATGDAKGKVLLAIYELQDDVLRVCLAEPDKPRPTEFSSTPGSGQSTFTARRVKE
jgi:uncharacterized protein (TIGR03067 family)